jgi:hypothetical protein
MPSALNTSGLYRGIVNTEAIRVYDRDGIPIGSAATAKRLGSGIGERESSDGKYLSDNTDFRIPVDQFPGSILPGWYITDTVGTAYTVLSCDEPGSYRGWWRCRCVSLMVLADRITWKLPARFTDGAASPLIQQTAIAEQAAAIQEQGQAPIQFQGVVSGLRKHFTIWTLQAIPDTLGVIGIDAHGLTYTLGSILRQRRLDELPAAYCYIDP